MEAARRRTETLAAVFAVIALMATATPASAAPGTRLWVSRYDSPAHDGDVSRALAVGPDGSTVFVTGQSLRWTDYVVGTSAYDASTGAMLWERTYRNGSFSTPYAIEVSPDGAAVFVTGSTDPATTGQDVATVAYDAETGATLWAKVYDGGGSESGYAIAIDPASSILYVTGDAQDPTGRYRYLTIAYDPVTGARTWVRRYAGPGGGDAYTGQIGTSVDGSTVFVTGSSYGGTSFDFTTVAYDAATGTRRWMRRYDGWAGGDDYGWGLSVSPDAATVFVTGDSPRANGKTDYLTIAYDVITGARRWTARYDAGRDDSVWAIGSTATLVFVTGESSNGRDTDYATVAYDAATGSRVWASRYDAGGDDGLPDLVVDPNGSRAFVTGTSDGGTTFNDYATIAYDASTGATQWSRRFDTGGYDVAVEIGVSPDGAAVFVAGNSRGATTDMDYTTVAYAAV